MRASHIFNPNWVSGNINDKQTNTLNLNFVPHTQPLLQELIPMNVKMPKSGRTKLEALYIGGGGRQQANMLPVYWLVLTLRRVTIQTFHLKTTKPQVAMECPIKLALLGHNTFYYAPNYAGIIYILLTKFVCHGS